MYAFLSFFGTDFSFFCFLPQKHLGQLAHKGTSQGKTIKKGEVRDEDFDIDG